MICNRRNVFYFADLLGLLLWQNTNLYKRLNEDFYHVTELMTSFPVQGLSSIMCGSFCIYIAHLTYDKTFNGDAPDFVYVNDDVLKVFLTHMLSLELINAKNGLISYTFQFI